MILRCDNQLKPYVSYQTPKVSKETIQQLKKLNSFVKVEPKLE